MSVARSLPKIGATAALMVGLAIASQSAASADSQGVAAAPAVSVTPSSDLEDGATVDVMATGFGAGATLYVSECADVEGGRACYEPAVPSVTISTDETGAGSTPFTVHRTFEGYVMETGHWGTVDCTVHSCYIAVSETLPELWKTPVSFG